MKRASPIVYNRIMMEQLLAQIERYDTYPAEDALRGALAACFGEGSGADAASVLWHEWVAGEGAAGWEMWVKWTETRLNSWHSLKINALETAWHTDGQAQDLQTMLKAVLVSLRQGIHDHPQLLPDAHFLQALAQAKHSFSFTQALRELRSSGLDLPPDDRQLMRHCAVCANAFKFLITQ